MVISASHESQSYKHMQTDLFFCIAVPLSWDQAASQRGGLHFAVVPASSGWPGHLQSQCGPPAHAADHRKPRKKVGSHCHASRPVANTAAEEDGQRIRECRSPAEWALFFDTPPPRLPQHVHHISFLANRRNNHPLTQTPFIIRESYSLYWHVFQGISLSF